MSNEEIETQIGRIIADGDSRTMSARDPVNRPMIHHLCDALDDRNPVYLDPDAARAAGFDDVVAPPSALQVWNMATPREMVERRESVVDRAYDTLRHGGYPNCVAVNCEQEYGRYLVPGDVLTAVEQVAELSAHKETRLGPGYFITTLTTYTDQHGEFVGSMRFRTLWYATRASADAAVGTEGDN